MVTLSKKEEIFVKNKGFKPDDILPLNTSRS